MTTLLKPVITEKSMFLANQGVFTFKVELGANKHQIAESVEKLFGVHVTGVTTTRVHTPTAKTGRRRISTAVAPRKFARVTLKKGESISLFDFKEE